MRTQRTTTMAERRLTCAGGEAKQQKAPSRPARGASACQRGQTPLRARERRSRMSCPCLSAHMPRHSHSMAQVDRGVKVMKVCGQLIPGRVLGIALVASACSRLWPAAPSGSRCRRKPETVPPDGLLCQAARHEGRTSGPGCTPTRSPSKSLRPSSQRHRRPRRLRHPCSRRRSAWTHFKNPLEYDPPAAGAGPNQF